MEKNLEPSAAREFATYMDALPAVYPDETLLPQIRTLIARSRRKVVVLDDDPTGAQAMQDVYVLTQWSVHALAKELLEARPLFFVLTDTRSLPRAEAVARLAEIAANLAEAGRMTSIQYSLMIRGDSTLRGHYPYEEATISHDPILLVPFFEEGGRYTIDDTQWVRERNSRGSEVLVPAAQTPYARDVTFGYGHSNLRNWIEEKSGGQVDHRQIDSISLDTVRRAGPDAVVAQLAVSRRHTTIANAAHYRDLEVLVLGLLRAEEQGRRYIVRCSASFARVRAGQGSANVERVSLGDPSELASRGMPASTGGLFVIGSHVPKTSAQLNGLLADPMVERMELDVPALLAGEIDISANISQWVSEILAQGRHAVVYTSRDVEPRAQAEGLSVARKVSMALVEIVRRLAIRPRFIVVKGGWTSSAIASQALGVRRAYAPSPVQPGVPMWILGAETRYPGLRYVVFPGNVGEIDALVQMLRL